MMITWHTSIDDRTCPICLRLEGHTWMFNTNRDSFPTYLYDPQTGIVVWDCLKDEPRPHGDHIYNCRCIVEAIWEVMEIEKTIHDKLTWAIQTKALPPASAVIQ